jgi:DNA-binding NarL/FixJ family response regulator
MIQAARAAGARGFLVKSDPDHQLINALETVCRHEPFFPSRWGDTGNGRDRH